jgi:hypothetical protein
MQQADHPTYYATQRELLAGSHLKSLQQSRREQRVESSEPDWDLFKSEENS